ncbi:anaerobic ribonucleoside-triphosphate reductase activating protein [Ruminiclostridium cellobioparum]|uniref:Anaerobic ribonucleoside-triphosphate reductase activating protein n=1 Tax=Ruminiclostridium cellobioparum subsp. termitidis CT1112 TaxID=1195236 RepID=S0FY15_RUMCE|nr:anaerobic ribonucleoside-triphosphate reductase activating protein [Ruminiclostridium cellobioparum]EMS73473.1 anaerobic ribonucleoside-triphosphate reductase activating protein [Ruminiclostridium cellobioparum subsp. termitidis CT1112]
MMIAGMVKSSLVDYPGMVSCVLFTPGCNFDCFYCHNRSILEGTHEVLSAGYVESFLRRRAGLLDGVVISGGEPTLQPDLIPFIRKIKKSGYKIKLDTNGSSPSTVKQILDNGFCDYFAVDYKAPAAKYEEICGRGAGAGTVKETIQLLVDAGVDFEVRTTVIPQLGKDDLISMSKELPAVPKYVLNRYRPPENYKEYDRSRIMEKPYSQEEIKSFAGLMKEYQPNTVC